ncbi:dolichyl-P-Man:Man(7)GlcNAc(2)-PP-dolichol alpha-1,6-mannosyltransferase [Coemansia sp. Benny D115]|nr:dolichyl-P-Man:Man(7)GlcNAc(2)-PP-dolichol alpha-1,6-mannosyltransferase [Coemansia sp. Benny D115]
MDLLFAAAVSSYALVAPYTKVEESFFMQAVHDALTTRSLSEWDHVEFPGAVPRSFVGPLALAAAAAPFKLVFSEVPGPALQTIVRLLLGLAVAWANARVRRSVQTAWGPRAAWWYGLFCVSQFHYLFWSSRLLANTLVLVPLLCAQADWLLLLKPHTAAFAVAVSAAERQRLHSRMAALLVFAAVVLRFDSAILGIAMLATTLNCVTRRSVMVAAAAAAGSLALTLAVDSLLWQTPWMWPEARAFTFNVVLGRSAEWGSHPPLHYISNLLPRLLPAALPFTLLGALYDERASRIVGVCLAVIAAFSINAHKEWRFVLPLVPLANACAAAGVERLGLRRLATGLCVVSMCAAMSMLYVSSLNYPGGHALAQLHKMDARETGVAVHIDTLAAMTGVTRFGQVRPGWVYNKTEGLSPGADFAGFAYVLTEDPAAHASNGFVVVVEQEGYAGIDADVRQMHFGIRQKPLIWIMRNQNYTAIEPPQTSSAHM